MLDLSSEISKGQTMKNATRLFYYETHKNSVAMVSYENFKGSWAFSEWFKKHEGAIINFANEQNHRFGYMSSKKWIIEGI